MAVQMPPFLVHEKFAKLKFTDYVSSENESTPSTPLTPDTPLLPPPEPFCIRTIGKDDTGKVLNFLNRFFFRDEPLNVDVKLLEGEQTCTNLEDFSLKAIKDNVSLMAITDSGKIIGVSLNAILERNATEEEELNITDPKFSKILNILTYVDKEADVFGKYPDVDKMILVEILSVDGSWRGQGIAKKLMNKTRAMASGKYKIEYVNEKDAPWIIEFLSKNFYVDEPITDYLKISDNPSSIAALKKFSTKNLDQNLSFVFRDDKGELLGVCINSIKTENDEDEEVKDPLFGKITNLLGFTYDEARVFQKFPDVKEVIYVDILSVNKAYGGRGIGLLLLEHTKELARKRGIKLLRVDCTSHFSARASEKLGMECVYSLEYKDYIVDGEQVFKPEPPHTGVKIYVQRLDS